MRALVEVGYDVVIDERAETFLTKKVLIRQYVLQTDIHPFVRGTDFKLSGKQNE